MGDRSDTSTPVGNNVMSKCLVRHGFEYVLVLSMLPNQEDTLSSKLSKSVDGGCLSKLLPSIVCPGLFFIAALQFFSVLRFVPVLLKDLHCEKLLSATLVSIRLSNVQRSQTSSCCSGRPSVLSAFIKVSIAVENRTRSHQTGFRPVKIKSKHFYLFLRV